MIAIFSANTKNKKWYQLIFNRSFIIKLFTWLYIQPEVSSEAYEFTGAENGQ